MKILSKNELNDKLGKYGWGSEGSTNTLILCCKYIGGIPPFDRNINSGKWGIDDLGDINLAMRPKGLSINVSKGFSTHRIGILKEYLNYWNVKINLGSAKPGNDSIVGNTVVGGLLFGPVGALAGAMSAKSTKFEYIFTISFIDNDQEHLALFGCKAAKAKEIRRFMTKNNWKYSEASKEVPDDQATVSYSVADEIIKLKELLDVGGLTQVEFDHAKKSLLNMH